MHSTIRPKSAIRMDAGEFLKKLMPPKARIFLATYANNRDEAKKFPPRDAVTTNPDDVAGFIAKYDVPGRASYFAVCPVLKSTRGKDHVACIPALFVDLDFKGIIEDPETIKAKLRGLKLKPSVVIHSGNGLHLYWLLAKPQPPEHSASCEGIMLRICAALAGDTSAAEVARVLRLPGSHNSKNNELKPVEVIEALSFWKRYSVNEIDNYFSDLAPLLTYKPSKAKASNVIPFHNPYQKFGSTAHQMTGSGFDLTEALNEMVFHDVQGHGIDDTYASVVGAMVADGKTVEDCIRVLLKPVQRVYERDREAGEPAFNEKRARREIASKFLYFTRRDEKKKLNSGGVKNNQEDGNGDDIKTKPKPKKASAPKSKGKLKSEPSSIRPDVDPPERPVFTVAGGELSSLASEGEKALISAREPIYQRGGALVRPIVSEVDAAHGRTTKVCELKEIDAHYLRDRLMKVADWQRLDGRSESMVPVNPNLEIAHTILARDGHWNFSPLSGVITTQTMRQDGSLLTKPGYDKATRLLLVDPPELPPMPEKPTRKDAEEALAKLRALIKEFPFVDPVAEAVALSGLITPIVRGAFANTPMHIARAFTPGSGKSFLWDTVSAIAMGFPMPVIAAGRTEEETEKRLGAALLGARPLITIDNLNGELGGDALCQIIERPVVEIRQLGLSKLIRIEARGTTCFATGNNLVVVGDLTRRVLISTLDARLERPELRKFKGNPVKKVLANRGEYIAACLTICRAYLVAGRPNKAKALGSFEGWSDTIRSALMWLGAADPVISMEIAREEDPKLMKMRDVLKAWHDHFGDRPVTLAKVIAAALDETVGFRSGPRHPELHDAIDAVAGYHGPADVVKLTYWVKAHKGRIVDGLKLMVDSKAKGGSLWRVEAVK